MSSSEYPKEDESLREQSLAQLREWIAKDPQIRKCQTDSEFLLRFLRAKKFSITDSFKLLVNYLITRKTIPHLFENLDPKNPEIDDVLTGGVVKILPEVDAKGCPVILYQSDNFNPKTQAIAQAMMLANLSYEIVSYDPRSQINGVTQIVDFSRFTLDILGLFNVKNLMEFAKCWQKTFPFRHRIIYIVNLPTYAVPLFNVFKAFLSEKLRKRLIMVNGWDEVKQEVGATILHKEVGGNIPNADFAKAFKSKALEYREKIIALNDIDIEVKHDKRFGSTFDSELDCAITGSFRKIQVD